MGKFFRVRKPRLTIGKKGLKVSGGGVSVGGKNTRVNISKSGVSTTTKIGKASYNSKRGCSMPLGILTLLLCMVMLSK